MKKILFVGFVFAASAALADTWRENSKWVYSPNFNREALGTFTYTITDAKTGESAVVGTDPETGGVDVSSLNAALADLRVSTTSIIKDAVNAIVPRVNDIEGILALYDQELTDLQQMLDTAFGDIENRLSKLELVDAKSGVAKSLSRASYDETSTRYVGENIFNVAGAQVDNCTISSNVSGRIQIYGYPGGRAIDVGLLPMIGPGVNIGKIQFVDIWDYFDGESLKVDRHPGYAHLPSTAQDKHGIHLAGWHAPEGSGKCNQTLVELMTNATWRASHYVLTRFEADGVTKMHYTPVGELPVSLSGASALKLYGTDGAATVVGTGSATNVVRFASAADSSVSVTVAKTNGTEAVVTIGVYWKN